MNYVPIHTNISPNINFLLAENSYLKQSIEYENAVLLEQNNKLASMTDEIKTLRAERDQFAEDAQRWKIMQQIIKVQGNQAQMYQVTKIVDMEIERGKRSLEQSNRRSS